MQDYTGDNRRAQVFHSHPITVKGIFLARNSLRSTMRVSQRNKISLALRVPSHVPHTTEKKSDPVYSTPARAISQSWLNKDSSNWGANRDGEHLLPEPGPCWPSGFCLWSAALAKPPSYKSSDETASQTPPGEVWKQHTHPGGGANTQTNKQADQHICTRADWCCTDPGIKQQSC